jgi:carbonic anhydrase/acetyltransferase-like protein (isoleucine patch superfamily)
VIHGFEGKQLQVVGDDWYVAPGAQLIGDVRLGAGASVWFNAVLRADDACIEIGAGSNVQDASVIHCDPERPTVVGRGVTVGHRVLLHGCTIGDHCLIGNGAIVLDGAVLGDHCLVGAGSLVAPGKVYPPGSVLMGAPAKVVREVGERELAMIEHAAAVYIERIRRYRAAGLAGPPE